MPIGIIQNSFQGLDIVEMKKVIKEIIPFDYTEEELISVLDNPSNIEFEKKDERWYLSRAAEIEINNREKAFGLRKCIDQYCDIFMSEKDIDRSALCELISKFIYDKFKESVEQISGIIDVNRKSDLKYSDDYSDENRMFI